MGVFEVKSITFVDDNHNKVSMVASYKGNEIKSVRRCYYQKRYKMYVAFSNGYRIRFYLDDSTSELMVSSVVKVKKLNKNEVVEVPVVEYEYKPAQVKMGVDGVKHSKYGDIKNCLECGIPVYLAGPAGSGKNHTVEQIAKENGWGFYSTSSIQQEYKLTGFIDAGGKYHETEFYKACTSKNDCVFFLDEMDASIPEVLVILNAAIANGYFEFPNGRVDFDKVHFVAAGNTLGSGADELYTGRMVLDQATLDRFAIIEFGYDKNIELYLAGGNSELVDFVEGLREKAEKEGIRATFSYRCITMVAKLEKSGMPLSTIIKVSVVKGLDSDTIKTLSNSYNDNKYWTALKEVA